MTSTFQILPTALLADYRATIREADLKRYEQLQESELSVDAFSFYTSVAAVFSSKIEGELTSKRVLHICCVVRDLE